MRFFPKVSKIVLAFILVVSVIGFSSTTYPAFNTNNTAEASSVSCSTVKYNGYTHMRFSSQQIRVGGAIAAGLSTMVGGIPGALLTGTTVYVASGTPITIRVYSAYCTQSGKQYLKQQFYVYNYANTTKLKGPYTRMVSMAGAGVGDK